MTLEITRRHDGDAFPRWTQDGLILSLDHWEQIGISPEIGSNIRFDIEKRSFQKIKAQTIRNAGRNLRVVIIICDPVRGETESNAVPKGKNKYPGYCSECGRHVPTDEGFLIRKAGYHAGSTVSSRGFGSGTSLNPKARFRQSKSDGGFGVICVICARNQPE